MARHRKQTKIKTGTWLVWVIIGLIVIFVCGCAQAANSSPDGTFREINWRPACVTEDSVGPCVWDAQTQGNGLGRSFSVDADGTVHFEQDQNTPLVARPTGPIWLDITEARARELAIWSDSSDRETRDWTRCWETVGDTSWIMCSDGWVEGS